MSNFGFAVHLEAVVSIVASSEEEARVALERGLAAAGLHAELRASIKTSAPNVLVTEVVIEQEGEPDLLGVDGAEPC